MQQEEITAYVVKELAKSRPPKDIVLAICEKTKMPWGEAEKLVRQVQSSRSKDVAARQSPLLIIFSIGLLLLGIGALFYGVSTLDNGGGNRSSFRMIFLGIGMILGGIIGLWNTIASLL
jgi:hypothetical protein